jgi:hypothetical protein
MNDIYKNPIFYYILIPVLVALWPLLMLVVYLPDADRSLVKEKEQYAKAEKVIEEILTVDPERLEAVDSNSGVTKFDYAVVVEQIAKSCQIAASNYNISSKPVRVTSGQKTQAAMVVLKEVEITKFAKFLSTIQLRWSNLQCENVTLTRKKGMLDVWKADVEFKYYY